MRIKRYCVGYFLLSIALICSFSFGYWLIDESEHEKVRRIRIEADELLLEEKREEANRLVKDFLATTGDGPLDPVWLPLIRNNVSNGYELLGYYVRILAGDPEREATYSEIANFIEMAPQAFHDEVKQRYLVDLGAVLGVKHDLLQKNHLLPDNPVQQK